MEKIFGNPFANNGKMLNETVMLIEQQGNCVGELLYAPTKVNAVMNSGRTTTYVHGLDYEIEGRKIIRLKNSSMPFITHDNYHGEGLTQELYDGMAIHGFKIIFSNGPYIFSRLISVDYDYDELFAFGEPLESKISMLPNLEKKLYAKEKINILWYGDSIAAGGDSSGFNNIPPYMPPMADLFGMYLGKFYGTEVVTDNQSVPGMATYWALDNAKERMENKTADLIILAWGMNDGTSNLQPNLYIDNIKKLVSRMPNSEFLCVSPMLPNKDCGFGHLQKEYSPLLSEIERQGVATLDMGIFTEELLKRKKFIDISSNNVNHPNDFMVRCYVHRMLTILGVN